MKNVWNLWPISKGVQLRSLSLRGVHVRNMYRPSSILSLLEEGGYSLVKVGLGKFDTPCLRLTHRTRVGDGREGVHPAQQACCFT